MRYFVLIAIFLPVISCGDDKLEAACEWDCRQTWACAFENGIDYELQLELCTENCVDVMHNAGTESEYKAGFKQCRDLLACSFLECMGVDVDEVVSHY